MSYIKKYIKTYQTIQQQSVTLTRVSKAAEEFILYSEGKKISVNTLLRGIKNIVMTGPVLIQAGVTLRADSQCIIIGTLVYLGLNTIISPPMYSPMSSIDSKYIPMAIGENTTIGDNCIISAASIGKCVRIYDNCVIGHRCILKNFCVVTAGSVVPPDTVIPSAAVFGGIPAKFICNLPEAYWLTQSKFANRLYHSLRRTNIEKL